jgi:hypothetical protein
MSKLNLIAIVSIVAAVSLIVGMAAPVFAQGNTTSAPAAGGNMSGMSMGNSSSANSTSAAAGNATSASTNSTK